MIMIYNILIIILLSHYGIKAQTTKKDYNLAYTMVLNGSIQGISNSGTTEPPIDTAIDLNQISHTPCDTDKFCVPFYQCSMNGSYNIRGEKLIDIRFDESRPCKSYLETCCEIDITKPIDTSVIRTPERLTDIKNTCGIRNKDGVVIKLEVKQDEAEYGELPWQIAILQLEENDVAEYEVFKCGGSLIHPQVVLTATHCIYKLEVEKLIVKAGEWDTQTNEEIYLVEEREISEVILHEKYSKAGLYNDIALLITKTPFELSKHINTICLPPSNTIFHSSDICFASGWGKDEYGAKGVYQTILRKIQLSIEPNDICQTKLQKDIGKHFQLHESFICASSPMNADTCKGDGGGPLICLIPETKDRYYQVGIVSWGIGCDGKFPGVFDSVSYSREWIDDKMRLKNFDTSYYTFV